MMSRAISAFVAVQAALAIFAAAAAFHVFIHDSLLVMLCAFPIACCVAGALYKHTRALSMNSRRA